MKNKKAKLTLVSNTAPDREYENAAFMEKRLELESIFMSVAHNIFGDDILITTDAKAIYTDDNPSNKILAKCITLNLSVFYDDAYYAKFMDEFHQDNSDNQVDD